MFRSPPLVLAALTLAPVTGAVAQPAYVDLQLQARSNFTGAHNLPNAAFFTNSTADINDFADVAFKVAVIGGTDSQGIWLGGGGIGSIAFTSPANASLTDATLDNAGRAVFAMTFSSQDGIHFVEPGGNTGFITRQPLGSSSWAAPAINEAGQIGYRASFLSDHAWVSWNGSAAAIHAVEASLEPSSPYSFLFTPSFNDARRIAGKVRLGGPGQVGESQPDQIRIFESDGSSILVAEDVDSNAASPFSRFDNGVSLTDAGAVAFTATLAAGGRGVYFWDGVQTIEIARTGVGGVADIEFFAPAANDRGQVAFRAFDDQGLRAVWVGDGTTLRRVVREHDLVQTDLGAARIDQHDNSPVFGGGVRINRHGDFTFAAGLTPPDNNQVEWGSGMFVALAARPGDLNCDGALDAFDIEAFIAALLDPQGYAARWPDCSRALADANEDGSIDAFDIEPFVALLIGP